MWVHKMSVMKQIATVENMCDYIWQFCLNKEKERWRKCYFYHSLVLFVTVYFNYFQYIRECRNIGKAG